MKVRGLQLLVLVAAFVVALPAVARAQPRLFCRMMEQVVSTCCCDSAKSHRRVESELRAAPLDCCERIVPLGSGAHAAPRPEPTIPPASLAVLLEGPSHAVERALVEGSVARPGRGPPPRMGSPLFITNCALLI